MKNIYSIVAAGFFGLMIFASCKKDYNCKCAGTITVNINGTSFSASEDTTITLGKMKKKDAKSKCDTHKSNFQSELDQAKAAAALAGGSVDGSISCDVEK